MSTEKSMEKKTGAERVAEIRRLRDVLGTAPSYLPPLETRFYRGVEGIQVDLLDGPRNPYRAMYAMATSTWGSGTWSSELDDLPRTAVEHRWDEATPEARFRVVNTVLARQALPLALEAPKFTFAVENLSRWSFDQLVRARIGFVAASLGTRDNCHLDMAFRLHEATWRDLTRRRSFVELACEAKARYAEVVNIGSSEASRSDLRRGTWQEARTFLPISVVHRFVCAANYAALSNLCARRMTFSEAEDTVAVAWLLRERLLDPVDGYPLLARWLRPQCDFAGACQYHRAHTFSEAFGCLFRSCGRNPVRSAPGNPSLDYDYADFNEACSDLVTIERQLGIRIPRSGEELPSADDGPEVLTNRDRYLFGFPFSAPRPRGERGRVVGRRVIPATAEEVLR
jgi:thymidylate synthase ThyX